MKKVLFHLLNAFFLGLQGLAKEAHRAALWAVGVVNTLRATSTPEALTEWAQTLTDEERAFIESLHAEGLEKLAAKVKRGDAAMSVALRLFRFRYQEEIPDNLAHLILQAVVSHLKSNA